MHASLTFAAIGLAAATSVHAGAFDPASEVPGTSAGSQTGPVIELASPRGGSTLSGAVPLEIVVRNDTTDAITLRRLEVHCPFGLDLSTAKPAPDGQGEACGVADFSAEEGQEIQPGRSFRVGIELLSGCAVSDIRSRLDDGSIWRCLALSAGDYPFRARGMFAGDGDAVWAAATLRFDPPFWVLFVGAMLGAGTVGLLRMFAGLNQTYDRHGLSPNVAIKSVAAFACLRLPLGLLTAAIAILLARTSTEMNGVLHVELTDVWGGFVVGLLAQSSAGPLGRRVGELLGGAQASSANDEPASAEDTAPVNEGELHAVPRG
jgi:hypothetical protein